MASAPHWKKKSCLGPQIKYIVTCKSHTKNPHNVLSKFTILCWAALTAILGCMCLAGLRLNTPVREKEWQGFLSYRLPLLSLEGWREWSEPRDRFILLVLDQKILHCFRFHFWEELETAIQLGIKSTLGMAFTLSGAVSGPWFSL